MRKPRPFSHSPIYINDRKQRLAEVERRARMELGLDHCDVSTSDRLKGVFTSVQKHRKGRGWRWNTQTLLMIAIMLIVLLIVLL